VGGLIDDPYDSAYARAYPGLYTDDPFWAPKHAFNRRVLADLTAAPWCTSWIDLCCGQAPFFADAPADMRCVGIDRSAAQLAAARARHPQAAFTEADVLDATALAGERFSLVTSFWGAYSYLGSATAVAAFVRRMAGLLADAGALYLEVIDPARLTAFNTTAFARAHGFEVEVIDAARGDWWYRDTGGEHRLCSPPVTCVRDAMVAAGLVVEEIGDVQTMVQLLAWRR